MKKKPKKYVWLMWLDDGNGFEPTETMAGVFSSKRAANKALPHEKKQFVSNHSGGKCKGIDIIKTLVRDE